MSNESDVAKRVLIKASALGMRLFRNNVGAGKLSNGSFVRWGLCNESKQQNSVMKSGDFIGIRPVVITPDMVGKTIGQFVSIETKRTGWVYDSRDEHQVAQAAWINLINKLGGYACFSTGEL